MLLVIVIGIVLVIILILYLKQLIWIFQHKHEQQIRSQQIMLLITQSIRTLFIQLSLFITIASKVSHLSQPYKHGFRFSRIGRSRPTSRRESSRSRGQLWSFPSLSSIRPRSPSSAYLLQGTHLVAHTQQRGNQFLMLLIFYNRDNLLVQFLFHYNLLGFFGSV